MLTDHTLQANATKYFERLCDKTFKQSDAALTRALRGLDLKAIVEKPWMRAGPLHAIKIALLYKADLTKRGQIIAANLKRVHVDFNAPLDEGVDQLLLNLGLRMLQAQFQMLETAYIRNLASLQLPPSKHRSGLPEEYEQQSGAIKSEILDYIWTMRHVPMKSPKPSTPSQPSVININGNVGAVQTGPNAVATIQQQWTQGEVAALVSALKELRAAIAGTPNLDARDRDDLLVDIEKAETELTVNNVNRIRLVKWLGGVAAAVQTTASLQPALEMVRTAAKAMGLGW